MFEIAVANSFPQAGAQRQVSVAACKLNSYLNYLVYC